MDIRQLLAGNTYPGRGVFMGRTEDGENAVLGYFIMGRSVNSRNRVFVFENETLYTRPCNESKVEDPSLIIYRAAAKSGKDWVVTNGDQTDTILEHLVRDGSFTDALDTRTYEPDAPHYTPRISGLMHLEDESGAYELSILKRGLSQEDGCERFLFAYPGTPGYAHLIHTYEHDGSPLPSFSGEPKAFSVSNDPDDIAQTVWESLDRDNRISLFVGLVNIKSGRTCVRIVNQYK